MCHEEAQHCPAASSTMKGCAELLNAVSNMMKGCAKLLSAEWSISPLPLMCGDHSCGSVQSLAALKGAPVSVPGAAGGWRPPPPGQPAQGQAQWQAKQAGQALLLHLSLGGRQGSACRQASQLAYVTDGLPFCSQPGLSLPLSSA